MPSSISGMTIDEMIEDVQNAVGNDSTALATYLMNKANFLQNEICNAHDWSFLHTTGNITVTADSATATLPSDCIDVEDIVDAVNGRRILRTEARRIDQADPSGISKGDITHYSRWGNTTIYVRDIPTADTVLSLKYKRKPTYLVSGSYTTIPIEYQYLLGQRLFAAALQRETDDRFQGEYQLYRNMLMEAIRTDMTRLEGDDRIKWAEEEGKTSGDSGATYEQVVRSWYAS